MATFVPPKRGVAYTTYVALVDQSNTKLFKAASTQATGDWKVSKDGGALTNLTTLPVVEPAGGVMVKIALSASEMTADNVTVVGIDASGAEWASLVLNLATVANQFDDLSTQASVNTIDDFLDTEMAAVLAAVDTEVAAIQAKTDLIPTDPADASDIAALIATLSTLVGTIPSAAAIATAVWASGTRTLTSFGTLIADIWANVTRTLTSGGGASAADVWAYATRALTQTAAQVAASVSGSDLTITRAVTFSATLTGLTVPATWTKMYFTVKRRLAQPDSTAIVQVVESNPSDGDDGLTYLNEAAAATPGDGSLTVNQGAGTVVILLTDNATAELPVSANADSNVYEYDVKVLLSDGSSQVLTAADATIAATPTEAIV